ncbi:MAG TPA: hypothetical protein PKV75_01145 [Desulfobacterales bacterium]|nr:hypothetical protein [Desulfobacterales bacterium]
METENRKNNGWWIPIERIGFFGDKVFHCFISLAIMRLGTSIKRAMKKSGDNFFSGTYGGGDDTGISERYPHAWKTIC